MLHLFPERNSPILWLWCPFEVQQWSRRIFWNDLIWNDYVNAFQYCSENWVMVWPFTKTSRYWPIIFQVSGDMFDNLPIEGNSDLLLVHVRFWPILTYKWNRCDLRVIFMPPLELGLRRKWRNIVLDILIIFVSRFKMNNATYMLSIFLVNSVDMNFIFDEYYQYGQCLLNLLVTFNVWLVANSISMYGWLIVAFQWMIGW